MSSLASLSGLPTLSAGAAINAGDALEIGPDGRAYGQEVPLLQTTDYMATAAVGVIAAQTVSGQYSGYDYNRHALLRGPDGSIYIFAAQSGNNNISGLPGLGIAVQKFSSILTNGVTASTTLGSTLAIPNSPMIHLLSNQTIALIWSEAGGNNVPATPPFTVCFAIVDRDLNVIVARTVVETAANGSLDSRTLFQTNGGTSAAGFVICYQQATNTNLIRFASYNNSGVAQGGSPVTIQTWGAAGNAATMAMTLLSNGNLAVITQGDSTTAGSLGAWVGVVSPVGAIVSAFANSLNTAFGTALTLQPDILAMPSGFFCAVSGNTTQYSAAVFNNAGAQQGANMLLPVNLPTPTTLLKKIVQNGALFFFMYQGNSSGGLVVSQITTGGVNPINTTVAVGLSTYTSLDAFYERNAICLAFSYSTQNYYLIISLLNFAGTITPTLRTAATTFGTAVTASHFIRIIPGGNFSFIAAYDFDYLSTAGDALNLLVQKYAPSAIAGVARGSITAPQAIAAQITPPAGGAATVPYLGTINTNLGCNYMGGTGSVSFNMTSPTPPNIGGREGNLTNNSMSISG